MKKRFEAHMSLVKVESLSFSRGERLIFDNISLMVPEGKITAILGPSGTGKTTLLKLIVGALIPQSGSVYFAQTNVSKMQVAELLQLRRQVGFLFQSSALFTNESVYDNVAFPLRELTQLSEDLIRIIVLMNLEAVGLRGACALMPSELSGGMARRVALARSLVLDPKLMMYDEPFTGQDPISMGVLVDLIKKLNKQLNMTSIIVSHDVEETLAIADYVYVIVDGKVLAHGRGDEIYENQNDQLQQFLQGLPDGPVPFHYPAKPFVEDLL